jgi:AraC-like DNA-binding protein
MIRKREGFKGQKAIIIPQFVQNEMHTRSLTKVLFITDIGYYPSAQYHFRERLTGSDQNILIYCTDGKGWIEVNNNRRQVSKDQFFIIPAKAQHSYGVDNVDPWTIYWIHFTGENAADFVKTDFSITNIYPDENVRNDRRIRLFYEIYQNLSMGFGTENLEYASICLWYLLGSFSFIPQFERIRAIQQHDIIEKSILYMQEHLDQKVNLTELAEHCGFSVSQYSLIFKKKTSRSPIEYFINLKIQHACQLLDFTSSHIKEISSQLDFEDQFYFSRVFRKVMGVSPIEYRKRKKG